MSRSIANVDTGTFTFYGWIGKTNDLLGLAANTVTLAANTTGDMSTGNGFVTGIFGANSIVTSVIRGGNVQFSSNSAVSVVSNTDFGNSSVNVLTTRNAVEQIKAASYTSTNTDLQAMDTFALADYRSGKYVISLTSATSYQITELAVLHDGTNTYTTEYATLLSGSTLATFSANVLSGNIRLNVTPTSASTTFKYQRTLLAV
jgi:hypothetical protein